MCLQRHLKTPYWHVHGARESCCFAVENSDMAILTWQQTIFHYVWGLPPLTGLTMVKAGLRTTIWSFCARAGSKAEFSPFSVMNVCPLEPRWRVLSYGLAVHDYGPLTIRLRFGCKFVLLWAGWIKNDPNIMKRGVPETFQFAEDHIYRFDRSKHPHHIPGSCTLHHSNLNKNLDIIFESKSDKCG